MEKLIRNPTISAASCTLRTMTSFSPFPTRRPTAVVLDGNSLTPHMLVLIGYAKPYVTVKMSQSGFARIQRARDVVDRILSTDRVVYGINTGFGNFSSTVISHDQIQQLQENLIRSHACGVGQPLSVARTRMLLALRLNVFAKGCSGIRPETVQQLLLALNKNCMPHVPCQGSVGASGDLAPLAHLALGMMGEGLMRCPLTGKWENAAVVLKRNDLEPIILHAKEGLALINGTQFICAIGAEAIVRAEQASISAEIISLLSMDALKASARPLDSRLHSARGHTGQMAVAHRMSALLGIISDCNEQNDDDGEVVLSEPNEILTKVAKQAVASSEIRASHRTCGKVQDSYTLRCIPQVLGIVNESIQFVSKLLTRELNAATDNPMVLTDDATDIDPLGTVNAVRSKNDASNPLEDPCPNNKNYFGSFGGDIVSGGNFHGEYPAKALDYLTIAIHEVASISERRIERLVNSNFSGLPPFLVNNGGLNSGFMMAHVTAAALVSENKGLCHPASVDSISTSAGQEDHVSMGPIAARKALSVVENVEKVLAIELLCAAQGIEFLRPLRTMPSLERVIATLRTRVPVYDKDRYLAPDIQAAWHLIRDGEVVNSVRRELERYASDIFRSQNRRVISF